jgi:hypothetical protein
VFSALGAALAEGDVGAGAAKRHQADVTTIASLGASIGMVKEALRLRGFGPMGARMSVAEPDDATAVRIAELVKTLTPALA